MTRPPSWRVALRSGRNDPGRGGRAVLSRLLGQWPRILNLPLILILAAAAVLFAPFLFQGKHAVAFHYERASWTGLPGGRDSAACEATTRRYDASPLCIHYPNEVLTARALKSGQMPVWNPYAGAGTPGFGDGSVYPFSPMFWPFYLFPNPWVYTGGLMLACLWGGFGIYLWLERFGLPPWSRGLGVSFWILSPWVTQFFTYSDVWAGSWFGWLLWSWDRAVKKGQYWWLPAPMVAGMVYCGHPEVALLLAGVSGAYAAASWATLNHDDRIALRNFAAGGTGAATLAAALTAVHWLPVAMRATESLPYKFVSPQALLRSATSMGDFFSPRTAAYLSPCIVGLALLGCMGLSRSRVLWLSLLMPVIGLAGLLQPKALGPMNGWLTLGGLVPGFYYRSLLWFGLIPLLASGAASLAHSENKERRWQGALLIVPVLLYLAVFLATAEQPKWAWVLYNGIALTTLALAAMGMPSSRRALLMAAALALAVLDPFVLFPGCPTFHLPYSFNKGLHPCCSPFTDQDPAQQNPSSWSEAKSLLDKGHGRMWAGANATSAPFLAPNLATIWGVRDLRIQDVLLGRRMALLHQTVQGPGRHSYFSSLNFSATTLPNLALLGVSYVGRPVDEDLGRFVWDAVPHALPRAYLVHNLRAAASEAEAVRLWRAGLTDRAWFRNGAIVEEWTGPKTVGVPQSSDSVSWVEDGLARVRLRVMTESGGMLILLDAFAEGWRSRLDGRPVTLYPANIAFRAVAVPPGNHVIVFEYRAPGLARGVLLAGLGWLALAYVALARWKRDRVRGRRTLGGAL